MKKYYLMLEVSSQELINKNYKKKKIIFLYPQFLVNMAAATADDISGFGLSSHTQW